MKTQESARSSSENTWVVLGRGKRGRRAEVNLAMHIVGCLDDLCDHTTPICRKNVATGWL